MRFVASMVVGAMAIGALIGCGNNSGPMTMQMPKPLSIAGNYSGSNSDSMAGAGTLTIDIVQAGMSVSGLWTFTYPHASLAATSFTGALSGQTLSLNIPATSFAPCAYSVNAMVSGKQISGSYSSSTCGNSGTFLVTRP